MKKMLAVMTLMGSCVGLAHAETETSVFVIERNFSEPLMVTNEGAANVKRINDAAGVKWLYSFLSADKKKTYCLYEAPNAEAIRSAAKTAGLPADVVTRVSDLRPEQFVTEPVPPGFTP